MRPVWRLIVDGPLDGTLNMALDRAAQSARESGAVGPTLRLYGWERPTVTLGRFQDLSGVDVGYCDAHGIDLAWRPTGGRGVLHDDEMTYAVIAGTEDGVPRGVAASYRYLCEPLAVAYRELGVGAELVRHDRADRATAACYLSSTRADLSSGARKLSGSAQVWMGSTVLQHGSFTRSRDVSREAAVFRLDEEEERRLASGTLTLEKALGAAPADDVILEAVVRAFESVLDVKLVRGEWTAIEATLVHGLLERRPRAGRTERDEATPHVEPSSEGCDTIGFRPMGRSGDDIRT